MIRVVVAKPGLDGHDVGAKLICRALVDAGMEVVYTGLRQSPAAIARAVVQEGADVVGLSILSGAHVSLSRGVIDELRAAGADDVLVVVGGCIPPRDRVALREAGVHAVFGTGSAFDDVVTYIQSQVAR
jgi:methylmalonyl-CoA mutase C-terminal domain/subunit